MRRLTILLAAVGALLLLPTAQAFAKPSLPAIIEIEGTGDGEVVSWQTGSEPTSGNPPIVCSYKGATKTASGVCENEVEEIEEGLALLDLKAHPAPGSEFDGWQVVEGIPFAEACFEKGSFSGVGECNVLQEIGAAIAVIATFTCKTEGGCEEEPAGPTNRRLLTLTKSGSGAGAVKSKPKGIACGNTCSSAVASLYKETSVVLTAKAAVTAGSNLEGWTGCDSSTNTGTEGTCTVKMTEARNVVAKFGGTQKAVTNPKVLTVSKVDNGFETGYGTVKGTGLACEADCTSTDVAYFGGVTEPKPKAAAVVTLTATKAAGSEFVGWTGCDSEVEGKCVVTMSSAKSVEAEFAALPKNTLTLTKAGAGAVKSKPKGVSCANTCSSAIASLASDTTVVLAAKAATGSTLSGWEGCDSSTNTGTEGTCTVAMSSARNVKATFTAAVKALVNPQTLTLSKAGSGYGTVKATGLTCEAACTQTKVAYYGGVTEPKPKAAATVTLTATSAPGSKTVVWGGCESEVEGKCVVLMSKAQSVTATFDELE